MSDLWGFIDAPEVSYRLAMAWDEWSDKIRPRSGEGWQDYVIDHGPDEHEPEFEHQSSLSFTVSPNSVSVNDLYTAPLFRNRGVAEAFIRRLHEDYPEHKINPGSMTSDGQAFHDRMLQKEPAARDLVTAANRIIEAMAWQDWKDKIQGGCKDGCAHNGTWGRYVIPQAGAFLDFEHAWHRGREEPQLWVSGIYTHPENRKDGVAEALMRRLAEDHPGVPINPGIMTGDGQKFHDRMLDKEPTAKDFVTAAIKLLGKCL